MNNYILRGHKPMKCSDIKKWAEWFEKGNRRVAESTITQVGAGVVRVSTVFLGIDHAFGDGPPELFETMIFGGEHDYETWRYATWDQAEAGHEAACKLSGISA